MASIRLLVLDIDGTLTHPNGRISPVVRSAVQRAMSSGCHVTLATGRSFALARAYADELELRLPLIVHSGASVRDSLTGESLYETPVPADAAADVVRQAIACSLQPVLFQSVAVSDVVLTGPAEFDTDASRWYLNNKSERVLRRPYGALAAGISPLNIAVPATGDEADLLIERIKAIDGCRTFVTRFRQHSWTLVEALATDSSKAAAMSFLADLIGVGMESVVAVGDQPNDLEMIVHAGIGVAMGNAAPEVCAQADVIAPPNDEDGVAWVIEQLVLKNPSFP